MNKMLLSAFLNLVLIGISITLIGCSVSPERPNPVGRELRLFFDDSRKSWIDNSPRPLLTTIWYPATINSIESKWNVGIFQAGWSSLNADIASEQKKYPLIVLSHGTGGAALQLSWLAETLAANGFLVMAINHHGNTAAEDVYLAQGFTLWWERAIDISSSLDQLLSDPKFGDRVDTSRIGVAGFSIGGYTVLSVAGGITSLEQRDKFCGDRPGNPICVLPPEAGFSLEELDSMIEGDSVFKKSISSANKSYKDKRVKAVYSIAPVHGPAFTVDSLASMTTPVRIVVGSNDKQAIPEFNAEYIASHIPNSELEVLPDVAHYTFLASCSLKGKIFVSDLCSDPKGVDRGDGHQDIGLDALRFFTKALSVQ